jgi:hypothetical protein
LTKIIGVYFACPIEILLNIKFIIQKKRGVKRKSAGIAIKPNPKIRIGSSQAQKRRTQNGNTIAPNSVKPKHKANKNISNIELERITIINCQIFILKYFLFKKTLLYYLHI